jgi:hypothetical protein
MCERTDNTTIYIYIYIYGYQSRYSYGLDGPGSFLGRGKIFLFSTASTTALGPTQEVPGVKRAGREADHSSHLVPGSRMVELYLRAAIRAHGKMLN